MSSSPTVNFHPDGTLFIVSGPSGAGKTTLINRVIEQLQPLGIDLHFSVSHTTRSPRSNESHGSDYYFVTREEFQSMVDRGEFIEWADVHEKRYGTSKLEVGRRLENGEDVILDIDYQGAKQIAENDRFRPHSLSVFIFPPSFKALQQRLEHRGLNTSHEIEVRMGKALREIEEGSNFYDYIVINDDVAIATECLRSTVVARKMKSRSALIALQEMARKFKEEP